MKKRTARNGYGKYHQYAVARGELNTKNWWTKRNPIGGPRMPANVRGH
jgi:hypothetical protein